MMKRFVAFALMAIMLLSCCSTAFADADVKNFAFTLKASDADDGYYPSNEYARKNDSTKRYASIRVTTWSAIPKKNLHTGIVGPGMVTYTNFAWMTPPSSTSESVRVYSQYKDAYLGYTGSAYKHYAAMRLNTVETVSTVKVSGVFTPDSW